MLLVRFWIRFNVLFDKESEAKFIFQMKRYEDCVGDLQDFESNVSSGMIHSSIAKDDTALRSVVEYYHSVVYQMRDNTDDLKQLSRKTVMEPLKKLNPEFATIASALKKRETLLK